MALVLAGSLVVAGCNFAIGAAAVGVAAVVAFVGYGCGEPVDVTVWDRRKAHPVCDAIVTAEQDGSSHEFSPCYRLHLGDGKWNVRATKPGYMPAVGMVTINKERRCSEPTFHTVVLTLVPEGDAPPPPAQVQSVPSPPAVPEAPASAAPAPTTAPPAPVPAVTPAPAPTGAAPAPPPSAAFPVAPASR